MVVCLDIAPRPFVRYLLELHIGRRGHIRYNNIYFPGDDAGWVEVRQAEPNATEWNGEDDYSMTSLSTPWSIVNGAAYMVGMKINKMKRKKIEWPREQRETWMQYGGTEGVTWMQYRLTRLDPLHWFYRTLIFISCTHILLIQLIMFLFYLLFNIKNK